MAEKIIVTIAREFGSEGHEIGKRLAVKLGIGFYDKEILGKAAENSGISMSEAVTADEKVAKRLLTPYLMDRMANENINDMLFQEQSRIIRDLAEKESCVIVGRLADYILRDSPNCIKVFVYAPIEERIKTIEAKYEITHEEAQKLVKRTDNSRNGYYTYYSNRKWNRKEGKDLLLNSTTFGVDGCVAIIQTAANTFLK